MIEILPQSTPTRHAVNFSGKLTGAEHPQFLDAVGERLKIGDQVNLVVELSSFELYADFEAARRDFKFSFGEYKRIGRAAFVDDQWIEWFTCIVSPFTKVEYKHFSEGGIEAAFLWTSA